MIFPFIVVALIGVFTPEWPSFGYDKDSRIRYIEQLLNALRSVNRNTLKNTRKYIQAVDNNRCRSAYTDLKTNCLLEAAEKNCKQRSGRRRFRKRCRLVSDLIITNKLGEKEFIDARTKYRIMKKYKKYRPAIRDELRRRYAQLAGEFGMSAFFRSKPRRTAYGIDGYCQRATQQRGLSWQYCVAAIVWFIGTSEGRYIGSD